MFRRYVLPILVYLFYCVLAKTWRFRCVENEALRQALRERTPILYAHWHGDELAMVAQIRRYRVATMTSTSKDGELMNSVIHYLGARTSRGSSTRGGASALKGVIRLLRQGFNLSMAVDGPKGPLHKVKPGVFELSRLVPAPIFPVAIATQSAFIFKRSWNKTFIPYPFARVILYWGDPLPSVSREQDPRAPELAEQLKKAINNAKHQADQLLIAEGTRGC